MKFVFFWGDNYRLPTFTLKNGIFETGKEDSPEGVIYWIDKESIIDLDDDGTKKVVFQSHFKSKSQNGDPSEVIIGRIKGPELKIIARVGADYLDKDFKKYYPNSGLHERISFNLLNNQITCNRMKPKITMKSLN